MSDVQLAQSVRPVFLDAVHDQCARIFAAQHFGLSLTGGLPSWAVIFQAARKDYANDFGCTVPEPSWLDIGEASYNTARRKASLGKRLIITLSDWLRGPAFDSHEHSVTLFRKGMAKRSNLKQDASFAEIFERLIQERFAKESYSAYRFEKRQAERSS